MEEIEWQFDAVDMRPVARWLDARQPGVEAPSVAAPRRPAAATKPDEGLARFGFKPLEAREITDTYFDTADWRFHRAGLSLRIRQVNGAYQASLKTLEPADDGLRQRTEISSSLPTPEPSALLQAEGRAGRWVRSLAGPEPPVPLFTVRSMRRPYAVLLDGQPTGEVVLDEAAIEQPLSEPVRLRRVEVEVPAASVDRMRPLVEDLRAACRLTAASASKFEVGLLTLDHGPVGLPEVGPLGHSEAPSMGELGYAALRRAFLAFLRSEAGTRVGEDIEALHDMRVAARRLRAALRLFEPALPKRSSTLRGELRWIAGLLGEVRDLDTQLAWIATWSQETALDDPASLDQLRTALELRRERARRRILQALDSTRFTRLTTRLARLLRAGPPRRSAPGKTPALAAVPDLLERRHGRVRKLAKTLTPRSPAEEYHRLRILCKRLRYAVENTRDLYGAPAQDFIDVLARLQDLLGSHQDAIVAAARLQELLQTRARRFPPRVIFLMGRASQRHEQQAAKLRKRFAKVYAPVQGKAWSRLQRAMEKRRGQPSMAWPPVREAAASVSVGE